MKEKGKPPFLMRFREPVLIEDETAEFDQGASFDPDLNLWIDSNGTPLWRARYRRPPTRCYTKGRTIPAGYTASGKYKSSKYRPGKTDKRSGK